MVETRKRDDFSEIIKDSDYELVSFQDEKGGAATVVFEHKKTRERVSIPEVRSDQLPDDLKSNKQESESSRTEKRSRESSLEDTTAVDETKKQDNQEPESKKQRIETQTDDFERQMEQQRERILEMGHIYFFYRPRIDIEKVQSIVDVQRLYFLLKPFDKYKEKYRRPIIHQNRLIVIGKKKLPETNKSEPFWCYVDKVAPDVVEIVQSRLESVAYDEESRAHEAVRPAGEGIYAIEDNPKLGTLLAYVLELPEEISDVQKAFNIKKEACYRIIVKNPIGSDPNYLGLEEKAEYPNDLLKRFGNRKWMPLKPINFLNYPHAEFLMIGESDSLDILGEDGKEIEEMKEKEVHESNFSPDLLYTELRLRKQEHPITPLIKGQWE
jgi:hypothetical protein